MARLIRQAGKMELRPAHDDPFAALVRSIMYQQLAGAAATAIHHRFLALFPEGLSPAGVLALPDGAMRAAGLSGSKQAAVVDLATKVANGSVPLDDAASLSDDDLVARLVQVRGIGRWTAEMFLIFNLMRPDVLPLDDVGLIQAISVNYFSGEPVTRSEAREVAANWEPWRTVATWYMWRSLDNVAV
jgi:DNA-3-methyladenine glycosylase II